MGNIERQFDYNEDAGMLRLLGWLCLILAPTMMWISFQDTGSDSALWIFGPDWWARIPPPLVTPVVRVFSVLLLWVGYRMIKSAGKMKKFGGRIAFTPTGLIMEAAPPGDGSKETPYQDISQVQVSERKGKKALTFWRADNYKFLVKASQMKSPAEFDEMAAMLAERAC